MSITPSVCFFFLFLFLHRRRHQQQRHSLFREAFNLRLICWLIYLWVLLCERNCVCVWEWISLCVTVSLCQWVSLWRRHCVSVSQCHWVWPVFIHKKNTNYRYLFVRIYLQVNVWHQLPRRECVIFVCACAHACRLSHPIPEAAHNWGTVGCVHYWPPLALLSECPMQ